MNTKGRIGSKEGKDRFIYRQHYGVAFWDARAIFIDYLKKGKNINGEYYVNLLTLLSEEIKQKRPHLINRKVLFHQDTAPAHQSVIAMAKINEL